MTDWREHNGGPQPVDDETWVEAALTPPFHTTGLARWFAWQGPCRYRILNQHLIDTARLEGIRLGLEAAKRHAEAIAALQSGRLVAIPSLDPDTIAKEAQHD